MSKSQVEKFREAARELGIEDAEYEAAVDKVAKTRKLSDDEIVEFAKRLREAKKNK